jgi:hypothetical protein
MGKLEYQCTPWGNPTYNIFGWQKPCYLLQDGYAKTFQELLDGTDWDRYGTGRNEKCADCMVHCGYEASAVADTFGSWRGVIRTVRAMLAPNSHCRKRAPSPVRQADSMNDSKRQSLQATSLQGLLSHPASPAELIQILDHTLAYGKRSGARRS